jgi:hypothetical protein
MIDKTFHMNPVGPDVSGLRGGLNRTNDPGKELFSITVAELWCIPDDKKGLRDKIGTTSRSFELKMSASKFVTHDERQHFKDAPDENVVLTNTVSRLALRACVRALIWHSFLPVVCGC